MMADYKKETIVELFQGDCLELMKKIPNKSVDLILCDLPYGTTACKWDSVIPFEPMWEQYERIIKDNGAIVLFGSEPFSTILRYSNLKNYRYDWIWEKEQGVGNLNAKKMPLKKHENISVFYKKLPTYNPQFTSGKPYEIKRKYNDNLIFGKTGTKDGYITKNDGKRYPVSILRFDRELKNRYHSTQKPVSLLEYLVKTYTNEGDTVLDNCMGSGSTGVACVNTGRRFIGIELDKNYFDIAKKRIKGTMPQPPKGE